jgi:hypothetical protein
MEKHGGFQNKPDNTNAIVGLMWVFLVLLTILTTVVVTELPRILDQLTMTEVQVRSIEAKLKAVESKLK